MWSTIQMWSLFLTVALAAAIGVGVVSFIMGRTKPHP